MKTAAQVDTQGFFQEDVIRDISFYGIEPVEKKVLKGDPGLGTVETEVVVVGYVIGEPVPQGLFMPKWNFEEEVWEEGLSSEEIEEITRVPEPQPTELDLLGQQLVNVEIRSLDTAHATDRIGQQADNIELEIMSLGMRSVSSELDTMEIGQQIVSLELENNELKTLVRGLQEDATTRDELISNLQQQINELKGGGDV